jgi:hypothetical protein
VAWQMQARGGWIEGEIIRVVCAVGVVLICCG